jgi:hypothetical protein
MASEPERPQAIERTPDAASTPGEGTRQGGCTLTDAEREAVRFAAVLYERGGRPADAATLRGLLKRTGPIPSGNDSPKTHR